MSHAFDYETNPSIAFPERNTFNEVQRTIGAATLEMRPNGASPHFVLAFDSPSLRENAQHALRDHFPPQRERISKVNGKKAPFYLSVPHDVAFRLQEDFGVLGVTVKDPNPPAATPTVTVPAIAPRISAPATAARSATATPAIPLEQTLRPAIFRKDSDGKYHLYFQRETEAEAFVAAITRTCEKSLFGKVDISREEENLYYVGMSAHSAVARIDQIVESAVEPYKGLQTSEGDLQNALQALPPLPVVKVVRKR